jgi:ATP-binding cassette, subfamily B, bacterial
MTKPGEPLRRFPAQKHLALGVKPRRVPVVRQLAATDCGAAALTMVLAFFGKEIPIDELRRRLDLSRGGSSAASLLRAGRAYGLRGRGVRLEIESLSDLPRGAILFWEFRHFVVFERFRRRQISIVDPASGRRSIPLDKFKRAFTGVALIFEPTEFFQRG